MEGEPMREKTYHIYLNEEERSRVIQSVSYTHLDVYKRQQLTQY